jgi:NAD-dependent SIR2 family protein deacetylase
VLIGAGAGLSADAGNDYMDKNKFLKNYPELVALGFQFKAQLMGIHLLPPEFEWSYLARHINEARFQPPPQFVYTKLYDLIQAKDYFVITSNVDWLFVKNGFAKDRIYTPQGDYARLQCLKPCSNATWPTKPVIEKILPNLDIKTKKIKDVKLIPKCPNCGGPVFMNVRGGNWFIEAPYKSQAKRFHNWVRNVKNSTLLIIEIGAGFNTPGVVRWPMEQIVFTHNKSHMIRVNLYYPHVPDEIANRSIKFKNKAIDVIDALWKKSHYKEN